MGKGRGCVSRPFLSPFPAQLNLTGAAVDTTGYAKGTGVRMECFGNETLIVGAMLVLGC